MRTVKAVASAMEMAPTMATASMTPTMSAASVTAAASAHCRARQHGRQSKNRNPDS
jgi:hypothetical protein